jgi:HEAT repeat protein
MLEDLTADQGQPAIARATAVALLRDYDDAGVVESATAAAIDKSDLVRRSAASIFTKQRLAREAVMRSLLADPVRSVRIEAAAAFAGATPFNVPRNGP